MRPLLTKKSIDKQIYELNIENKSTRGTLVEIHMADLHFGAICPRTQYQILKEQCLDKIRNIHFDIFSINGDFFEHKFMSNSDAIMYGVMFMNEIVELCKMKNATLVVIHGTAYHDASQLKLFYHYLQDPMIDIRIVEDVKFEYIKGAKVLCIPELYGKGEDYYKHFLFNSGLYDSVFMHGVIKGAIYEAKNQESGIHSDKAPTFTIEDFRLCRGPILSGHVHTPGCFDSYFYYCGSPIRTRHGEEQEKGFLIVLHNLDTQEHYVHLEPIKSFRYDTVNLDDLLMIDPKNVIEYVNKLQSEGIDYIRIEFKDIYTDQQKANLDVVKNYYKNNNRIKIKADNNKLKQVLENNNELSEKYNEYDYIMDRSLSEYEILTLYINQQVGHEYITVDELKKILAEDI